MIEDKVKALVLALKAVLSAAETQGLNLGEVSDAADIQQRNATRAWGSALRQVSTPLSPLRSTLQPHAKLGASYE
jgi:hypothetical protein